MEGERGGAWSTYGTVKTKWTLVGKPEGTSRRRRRRDDNIEMDIKKKNALAWTSLISARIRTSGVSCKQVNEPLFSIN